MVLNNIAVVGGGTSGLITALLLRKHYPTLKIDLIESSKIGIVGVGEGSTEHWSVFMHEVDINLAEIVRETDATFKYGIKFENWNGNDDYYFHSVSGDLNIESPTGNKMVYSYLISNDATPQDLIHPYIEKSLLRKDHYGIQQLHFNTFKLNKYLHDKCAERNIGIIEADISDVKLDSEGYIDELRSNDGRTFEYDFYVDSTGFSRLLMEKTLKVKWNSYSKYLPVNSAIAFPTERTEEISAYTLSLAMKYGWLWRIPTQDRWGNGYVFNDKYIDFDQAQKEVEELYGHPIEVGKRIKFDAGCLEKFWYKNCAAIGLSGSFIEPLEASSIGTSIQQAFLFCKFLSSYVKGTTLAENHYNKISTAIVDNILDFVALHYRVKRRDTEFWKDTEHLPLPPGLEERIEIYKHKMPSNAEFDSYHYLFQEANWILVMHGLGLIDKDIASESIDKEPPYVLVNIPLNLNRIKEDAVKFEDFVSHREAIEKLKGSIT